MHRGRSPAILVAKLMGWSLSQADTYVANQGNTPDDFARAVSALKQETPKEKPQERPRFTRVPDNFRVFDGRYPNSEDRFRHYLHLRGFREEVNLMIAYYRLRYCITGEYRNRLVIPVFYGPNLMTWTARAIVRAEVRYKSLEDSKSAKNIKDCLLIHNRGEPSSKDTLALVEGPLDAMKLGFYGRHFGINAACIFGKTLSEEQRLQIISLSRKYRKIWVILDEDARLDCGILVSELNEITRNKTKAIDLAKYEVKDPADLTIRQVEHLAKVLSEEE